jgi:hypothetical protein
VSHCPHCGCELERKSRSLQDHRRLFGLLRAAYLQWPETHSFQPSSEEELRAYLLISAGHFDVTSIPAPEACSEHPPIMQLFRLAVEATVSALSRKFGYCDIRISTGGVEILTAKSIDFRTVGQREFGPIREAMESLIEDAVGVKSDQLLREKAA